MNWNNQIKEIKSTAEIKGLDVFVSNPLGLGSYKVYQKENLIFQSSDIKKTENFINQYK